MSKSDILELEEEALWLDEAEDVYELDVRPTHPVYAVAQAADHITQYHVRQLHGSH
jgi:hypothetical protein